MSFVLMVKVNVLTKTRVVSFLLVNGVAVLRKMQYVVVMVSTVAHTDIRVIQAKVGVYHWKMDSSLLYQVGCLLMLTKVTCKTTNLLQLNSIV